MPTELPYLNSYKNVGTLFANIGTAKRPDNFNHAFLKETLGLKSSTDRPLVSLLKTLGFIDAAGKPTTEYDALKNPIRAPYAIGNAVRRAYAPLFEANENANGLSGDQLKGLIAQVAGTDEAMTNRVAYTFGALLKLAKFDGGGGVTETKTPIEDQESPATGRLRPEFHYNIQVHLPSNATEETYISIFNAIRQVFR